MVPFTYALVQALLATTALAALPPQHIQDAFKAYRQQMRVQGVKPIDSSQKAPQPRNVPDVASSFATAYTPSATFMAIPVPTKILSSSKGTSSTSSKSSTTSSASKPSSSSSKTSSSAVSSRSAASTDNSVQTANTYSENWSGAVLTSPPSGTFNSITGQWTLPSVSAPAGGVGQWYSAEWIGIDGYTCSSAILQAGTLSYIQVDANGATTTGAAAWYEWYPEAEVQFTTLSVQAGDVVSFSIQASSKTSGTITVKNLSSGQTATQAVSAASSSSAICGSNAEWILEDFASGSLVPFSAFSDVSFTNCVAGTTTGATAGLSGAAVLDIQQNGQVLTSASTIGQNRVAIRYVGPTSA